MSDSIECTTGLRRIDENALNCLLDHVPKELVHNLIRKKLPKPSTIRARTRSSKRVLPPTISRMIKVLGLFDMADVELRAKVFIGYLKSKRLSYNTVSRYFAIARSHGLFDYIDSSSETRRVASIRPDPTAFCGKLHTRILSLTDYVKLYSHLTEHWSEYTAPLLVAFHTGLRSMEILQMTSYTLYQLKTRQSFVNVKRKQTIVDSQPPFWKPVYSNDLLQFTDKLIELYKDNYNSYFQHSIDAPLFHITTQTLVNRIRLSFFQALGYNPPHGFGIHTCRYMMAQILASTSKNLVSIQTFLQHKSLKTTQRYLKSDFDYTVQKFNEITKGPFADIREDLKPPQLNYSDKE
ncbi:uncharacterized protein LOC120355444 [Nilaparvata lugens]|uniref:uncharacterized protein LOC120355444 n=1 Tax=Nilaparvata lugens TaxID=108931 RepID=UPI00193DFD98|nr:uncharacterized protein LOC120355444 [Nilaparvata lugens]